jgi:septal ring factor EnvC (AmiA/AmiB activator)
MISTEPKKKPSGRPRSYSSEQLAAAIDSVRNDGHQPIPDLVSKALSELFRISGTVRVETLAREIQAHLESETLLREDTLVRALPNEVTSRIDAQFIDAKRLASLIVAEELERLSKAQLERDMSASRERAMLVAQNHELEAELEEARAQNSELAEANGKVEAEKSDLVGRLRDLEQEIQKLQAAGDARNGIVAELERFLATQRGAPPEAPQP